MEKEKKAAICVYVDPEVLERLKQICKHEEKSQGRFLSIMIMNYKMEGVDEPVEPPKQAPKPMTLVKKIVTAPVKKEEPKKFNLAEALAQTKGQ